MMTKARLEEMKKMVRNMTFGSIWPAPSRLARALQDAIAEIEELQAKLERFTEGPRYP